MVSEKISTLPDGVGSGAPCGSARKRSRVKVCAGTVLRVDPEHAALPEGLEVGKVDLGLGGPLHRHLPEMLDPLPGRSRFGEALGKAQPFGKAGEDRVVVSRLLERLEGLVHRRGVELGGAPGEILALERRGHREDDVRMARGCGPERLVDDDGLGLRKGSSQAVQVLMVVEGVAARPKDQADIGIGQGLAVERHRAAGLEQHVGDARDGDEGRDRIVALGQCSDLERRAATAGEAEIVDAAIAVADALAGQAEIAEHGAEHRDHPIGLIAVLGPLQRPADRQEAGLARHPAGKRSDPVRLDVADRRRPVGIFWHAIALARADRGRSARSRRNGSAGNPCRAGLRCAACAPGPASARHRHWDGSATSRHRENRRRRPAPG